MNFWNNPEYSSLKILLVAVLAGAAGGFIYSAVNRSGDITGRVIGLTSGSSSMTSMTGTTTTVTPLPTAGSTTGPSTTGGTTGGSATATSATSTTATGVTTGGGAQAGGTDAKGTDTTGTVDGRESPCYVKTPITLTTRLVAGGPVPTFVTTSTSTVSPTSPGRWISYTLTNPSNCPVQVTQTKFYLDTNDMTPWPPIQWAKLLHNATQVGATLEVPGTSGLTTGPATLTFSFPGSGAVTILPHATERFTLTSASQNVNAQEYGYSKSTTAAGATTTTGTIVYFKLQLTEFLSNSTVSGVSNTQKVSAGTIPATIITPAINIY